MKNFLSKNKLFFLISLITLIPLIIFVSSNSKKKELSSTKFCINRFTDDGTEIYPEYKAEILCDCLQNKESLYGSSESFKLINNCLLLQGRPINNNGAVSLKKSYDDYSLGFVLNSLGQDKIRGSYGRYLSMTLMQEKFIPGKPGYTQPGKEGYYVPGKPGKIICNSGCSLINCAGGLTYNSCREVGGTQGYYVPAVAPRYIPPVPDRIELIKSKLTFDCKDKTFDIKNDGKNWDKIENVKGTYLEQLFSSTCPFISELKKN